MEALKDMVSQGKSSKSEKLMMQCEDRKKTSLEKCPRVLYIIEAMTKMGCKVENSFYKCMDCDGNINGGFSVNENGKPGIVLCQNHLSNQDSMDRTMSHELLHAYDHCRAKMNWRDCEQHACSEIRAAALSGDCDWKFEAGRGNIGNIFNQHRICVQRRAELSLSFNEPCKGKEKECVEKVFDTCYKDTNPFYSIP